MKAIQDKIERPCLWRGPCARPLTWMLVCGLSTMLFAPATMPRTTAMLALLPAQGPSEEESNSTHAGETLLVQLASASNRRTRRLDLPRRRHDSAPRFDLSIPVHAFRAALRLPAELASRNGIGAPLRC